MLSDDACVDVMFDVINMLCTWNFEFSRVYHCHLNTSFCEKFKIFNLTCAIVWSIGKNCYCFPGMYIRNIAETFACELSSHFLPCWATFVIQLFSRKTHTLLMISSLLFDCLFGCPLWICELSNARLMFVENFKSCNSRKWF